MINDCRKCGRPEARPVLGLERIRLCADCRPQALRELAVRVLEQKPQAEQGRVR